MKKTWRWFGDRDQITLPMLKQIGVEGIVTALQDVPKGEVWSLEEINKVKWEIEEAGLTWSVVESLHVCEAIKAGAKDRDKYIENYKQSIANLGQAGIRTVCYNFMPVLDWIRTDLSYPSNDGSTSFYFDKIKLAYFDLYILKRKNATKSYTPEELEKVESLASMITQSEVETLIDSIIVKTQGFAGSSIKTGDEQAIESFKKLLAPYENINKEQLRENLKYFLEQVIPVCEKYDVNLCIHPDDPPFSLLGLPRIVADNDDLDWILKAVDNPRNGLTFCAGSLSASEQNDVPALAQKYVSRTHFVHLRSTSILSNGNFIEGPHLAGQGHLIDLVRIFERNNPGLPMRVDHGRLMMGDPYKGCRPGYSFMGRMYALAQLDGVIATIDEELMKNNKL